jgi:ABC-2 type transport system permease protein
MKAIFELSLRWAWRSRMLQVLGSLLLIAFVLSAINGVLVIKTREKQFEAARQEVRIAWLNQGPQNPHNAGHYGHYVFRPVYAVQLLDNGISQFAGNVLRLEAHAQNDPNFSLAESRTESSRLGNIGFSWLLQVLLPLFIILLNFNAVTADRELQNLQLIAAQGISNGSYLFGKILAGFVMVAAWAVAGFCIQWLALSTLAKQTANWQDLQHALAWIAVYLVYFWILTCISVVVGAACANSRQSLLVQISAWVLLIIIMPKLTANLGASLHPLEQRTAFNKELRADREKGIDGHNPADERYKAFEDSLLRFYKVDSLKNLPINADGLAMQADEEYANLVFDKHFARIRNTIGQQNSISRYAGALNPFLAVRNISMGLAQSDYLHQLQFLEEAETYRRSIIKNLNDKMAYGGSKTGDWDWTVDASFWETVPDFDYKRPTIQWSTRQYHLELAWMLMWVVFSGMLVFFTAQKMKTI